MFGHGSVVNQGIVESSGSLITSQKHASRWTLYDTVSLGVNV